MKPRISYSAELESTQDDENEVVEDLNNAFDEILETTAEDYGHAVRAVHAKGHGILQGILTVPEGLAPELAQGLFAKPGKHAVWLRLSTNAGDLLDDAITLPRGLAMKVAEVEGERLSGAQGTTQDFVMVNGPIFQARDAKAFHGNLKMLAKTTDRMEGTKKALSSLMRGVSAATATAGIESPKVQSLGGAPSVDPLGETYYSVTPFRYGAYVAKFSLAPVSRDLTSLEGKKVPIGDNPDSVREAVREDMRSAHGRWEFRVQLLRDVDAQPVGDPTVEWADEVSPFETVAVVEAGPQDSWSPDLVQAVDEEMRFSVRTGLSAHQPLGNINRARKETYRHSARFRERFNGCPIQEPAAEMRKGGA